MCEVLPSPIFPIAPYFYPITFAQSCHIFHLHNWAKREMFYKGDEKWNGDVVKWMGE